MNKNFEYNFFKYLQQVKNYLRIQPLNLGGASGSGGGVGGPPGGYIGQLPQTRVGYDIDEVSSSGVPSSGISLLDNLNHIRYRISSLEANPVGNITVEKDDLIIASGITNLNFEGNVSVIDNTGGKVTVSIVAGSGTVSIQNHQVAFGDESNNAISSDKLTFYPQNYGDYTMPSLIIGDSADQDIYNRTYGAYNIALVTDGGWPVTGGINYSLASYSFQTASIINFYQSNGTLSVPSQTLQNDTLLDISAYGFTTFNGGSYGKAFQFYLSAMESFSGSSIKPVKGIIKLYDNQDNQAPFTALDFSYKGFYYSRDIIVNDGYYIYLGDKDTDDSWRFNPTASGIQVQKRISNGWVTQISDALTNLKVDYTTGDLDSEAEIISAINATNTRINDILDVLRERGIIST